MTSLRHTHVIAFYRKQDEKKVHFESKKVDARDMKNGIIGETEREKKRFVQLQKFRKQNKLCNVYKKINRKKAFDKKVIWFVF